MHKVLIFFGEIVLKGKNRRHFEHVLLKNVKDSAERNNTKVRHTTKENKCMLLQMEGSREDIIKTLEVVFGIKYFLFIEECAKDVEVLKKKAEAFLQEAKQKGVQSVAFKTRRIDKNFLPDSPGLNKEYGHIAAKLGLKTDYKNAETTFFTRIQNDDAIVSGERHNGFGGLPLTTSGKVLTLLSGGIDSPVAAWNMMKRGCRTDFLHVHTYRTNQEAYESKIKEMVKVLNQYQFRSNLYLVPYSTYEMLSSSADLKHLELVTFKHFILKLANKLAWYVKFHGIVTGDNLGQVASQTMINLRAASWGIDMPIFRPLLTYDKEEIIQQAETIGTFELSKQQYKDCCSIISQKQITDPKLAEVKAHFNRLPIDEWADKLFPEIEKFKIT